MALRVQPLWPNLPNIQLNFTRQQTRGNTHSTEQCGTHEESRMTGRGAVTCAIAEVCLDNRPAPSEVVDAIVWALGLAVGERYVAEKLARQMGSLEQEAVLKWREGDGVSAASALAGAKGELPSRRRLDVTLRLKRIWGWRLVRLVQRGQRQAARVHAIAFGEPWHDSGKSKGGGATRRQARRTRMLAHTCTRTRTHACTGTRTRMHAQAHAHRWLEPELRRA